MDGNGWVKVHVVNLSILTSGGFKLELEKKKNVVGDGGGGGR